MRGRISRENRPIGGPSATSDCTAARQGGYAEVGYRGRKTGPYPVSYPIPVRLRFPRAHAALALGLVAVSLVPGLRVDLMGYLVGDILAVSKSGLALIWGGAAIVTALMAWRWSALLSATLSPDLAQAAGVNPRREQLVLTLALAVTVAVAIKVVGALLLAALLIIPAAAARPLSRTPESMAIVAMLIGGASALGGLMVSFAMDTPTGPTIVSLAAAVFCVTQVMPRRA